MSPASQVQRVLLCVCTVAVIDFSRLGEFSLWLSLSLFLASSVWFACRRQWWPLVAKALIAGSIAPIEFALIGTNHAMTLLPNLLLALAMCGFVWLSSGHKLAYGAALFSLVVLTATAGWFNSSQEHGIATARTMSELERDLLRGSEQAISPWIKRAMAANVGPKRLRQVCSIRDWSWDPLDKAEQYGQKICQALKKSQPEEGALILKQLETGTANRLAADLYAEAGLWPQAARATHDAVKGGGLSAALNLWRWRAIKGKVSRRMETWEAWNAEMTFDSPAGAERSALRIIRAPGELKPMHIGPSQRAVMITTRYREQFEISLPGPPSIRASKVHLKGRAGRGFALEILDANQQWHAFQCTGGNGLGDTGFCNSSFGSAFINLNESIPQPLRQMRVRGEAVLARIEVTQK